MSTEKKYLIIFTGIIIILISLLSWLLITNGYVKLDSKCCQNNTNNNSNNKVIDESNIDEYEGVITETGYGSAGALKDNDLTLEEMLKYAIEDEYLAKGEYESIIAKYGSIKPFSNIINAEKNHIEQLKILFTTYKINIPSDESSKHLVQVASLNDAYKAGVNAEILNIQMYDLFLGEPLNDDVRLTFTSLKNASFNHLNAFNKKVAK